jgi:TM2 domain-containing membrane protein YozV
MTEQPSPPAGWYPHEGGQRYWDGHAWTDHTAPAPSAAPMPPHQYGVVPYTSVAPKSPAISLLASFFIPGLGSMLNGEVGKGIGILVGYLVSAVLVLVLVGIIGVFAFWVWGMVDAYQGAQRWNARHGILS